jgi:hypothetical protein
VVLVAAASQRDEDVLERGVGDPPIGQRERRLANARAATLAAALAAVLAILTTTALATALAAAALASG